MYEVTEKYKSAIQSLSRTFKARVVVGDYSFNERDVVSLELDEGLGTGDNFMFGGGYVNALNVEIGRIIEGLTEGTKVQAFVSLLVENEFVEIPLGVFYIKEAVLNRNSKRTKIEAQDEMFKLNGTYKSELVYPTSTRKVVEEIAELTNIRLAQNLNVIDVPVKAKLEKTSVREMLVYIAQLNASFVRFNRYGQLEFVKLENSKRRISKANYFLNSLEKSEVLYRLDGITNELSSGDSDKTLLREGRETGNVIELKNPLIDQNNLSRVYNEYRKLNYYPYSLKWQGDMAIFSGEWINIESYDGQYINVPVLSQKLSFNGGLSSTISARGSNTSSEVKEYKGSLTQRVDYLDELVSNQGVIYADVDEPTKAKNGDVWFMPNGGTVTLKEYINGEWVTKADTADLDKIVNTMTTDEIISKKISAAVAQIIEINANKIVAGDIDLQRVRIMQGTKEVLAIRDGKLVMNLGESDIYSELTKTVNALENSIYQKTTIIENLIQDKVVRLVVGESKQVPVTLKAGKSYDFKFSYIGDCEVYVVFEFRTDKRKYPYRYSKKKLDYMRFGKKVSSIVDRHQLFSFKAPNEFLRSYILYRSKQGARIYDLEFSQNSESLTIDKISKLRQDLDNFSVDMQNNLDATKSSLTLTTKEFATKIEDYKKEANSLIQQKSDAINLSVSGKVDKSSVISAINLSPEGVKIRGSKINVTGDMFVEGSLGAYRGKIGDFYVGKYGNQTGEWITNANFQVGMGSLGRTALWVNWGSNWNSAQSGAWHVQSDGRMYVGNGMDVKNVADFASGSTANFYGAVSFQTSPIFKYGASFGSGITVGGQLSATGGIWTGNADVSGYSPGGGSTSVVWWSQKSSFLGSSSDRRLKENIQISGISAVDIINQMRMVSFDWKKDHTHEEVGLIAQEVQEIIPKAVTEMKDGHLGINYLEMVPYLLKSVQELSAENKALKARIEKLEEKEC